MHNGILGLILYLANWLSPGMGDVKIDVDYIKQQENRAAVFQCRLDAIMSRQLEQLIDAGIPLRFKFVNVIDQADTISFVRSLTFNMVEFTYSWSDSLPGNVIHSKEYSLIHLAMVDFCKWKIVTPESANYCRIDVTILPSRAEQLNMVVDMSRIWGQQKVTVTFNPQNKINRKGLSGRKGQQ